MPSGRAPPAVRADTSAVAGSGLAFLAAHRMRTRNESGLSPRTLREYAAVLQVGLVDGGLNAERGHLECVLPVRCAFPAEVESPASRASGATPSSGLALAWLPVRADPMNTFAHGSSE